MLRPGYHYSRIPGGLQRIKLHSRPSDRPNKRSSSKAIPGMTRECYYHISTPHMHRVYVDTGSPRSTINSSNCEHDLSGCHQHPCAYSINQCDRLETRSDHGICSPCGRHVKLNTGNRGSSEARSEELGSLWSAPDSTVRCDAELGQHLGCPLAHYEYNRRVHEKTGVKQAGGGHVAIDHHHNTEQDLEESAEEFTCTLPNHETFDIDDHALNRQCHQLVDFRAAATKLDTTTKAAVAFFRTFQSSFDEEVHGLKAYANRKTVRAAWKDKVMRNERYHSSPQRGWAASGHSESHQDMGENNHDQGNDWADGAGNTADNNSARNNTTFRRDHVNDRHTTFCEHQSELRQSIAMFLDCQILKPRLRYGTSAGGHSEMTEYRTDEHDDNVRDDCMELEDIQNINDYNGARKLRGRVKQCQADLLRLLTRIRDDPEHMEAALIELDHLASLLQTYRKVWSKATAWSNRTSANESHRRQM